MFYCSVPIKDYQQLVEVHEEFFTGFCIEIGHWRQALPLKLGKY